jgi:Uncharacterized protein family UPF0016
VIFIAEWGDLTQILTVNLATKYQSPLSVGVGAVLALWAVWAIAVVSGQALLRHLNVPTLRKITTGVSSSWRSSPLTWPFDRRFDSSTGTSPSMLKAVNPLNSERVDVGS